MVEPITIHTQDIVRDLSGNVLGSARAETDELLEQAFVETADYRALINTQDFNYVVGRRGTGKSALYNRLGVDCGAAGGHIMLAAKPEEHQTLLIQQQLRSLEASYREMRAVARLAWRVHLLLWTVPRLVEHYKLATSASRERLERHRWKHEALLDSPSPARVSTIIREACVRSRDYGDVSGEIASRFEIARLQDDVQAAIADSKKSVVVLLDGLDEGWIPSEEATAVLGGLAAAVADFDEARTGIHGTLFIRDNMFRALAHFDQDFSRHIEGNTLRLHWDEHSLFDLVVTRLRVILKGGRGENPERVWNLFVAPDLAGRGGFDRCLHQTLYRPRDILVLLNRAYVAGQRRGEKLLSGASIELAAREISHDRLDDLAKEYDQVLPGARSFVRAFEGRPAFATIQEVVEHLDEIIARGPYTEEADSDFALLGSGRQVLSALYGIGFLGFEDSSRRTFVFCHDGSGAEVETVADFQRTVVHPCYWKALELSADQDMAEVVVEINDEFDAADEEEVRDLRVRRIGQVLSELSAISTGPVGALAFEDWVLRSVKRCCLRVSSGIRNCIRLPWGFSGGTSWLRSLPIPAYGNGSGRIGRRVNSSWKSRTMRSLSLMMTVRCSVTHRASMAASRLSSIEGPRRGLASVTGTGSRFFTMSISGSF